jgi:site-specific DNA-methyltransferase (adenine-specific)
MGEIKVEYLNLNKIIPYENNPRNNDDAVQYVANSIKQFGFNVPIVIDKNNVIVAGHTRLKAAKKLKLETIPCIRANNLSDNQIKAFRLADNKVAEKSFWDLDKLNVELENIDFDMNEFGFNEFNMSEPNFDELEKNDKEENNDEEKFVVRISFPSYKEWWEIENEFRSLIKNTKATVYIEKI